MTNVNPLISVIICTHNRASCVERSILSVLRQASADPFELIVVDNGSTDATAEVARMFEGSAVFRYAYEPSVGLSRARNLGRRIGRGRYIAYLDDDAVAMPGWLSAIARGFACTSGVAIVGGRVDPVWEAPRPRWLSDELAGGLAVVNWSDQPRLLRDIDREWLVGANIAFDAGVLDELGGFNEALGRSGERLFSGEEIALQRLANRRGYGCLYDPGMHVQHTITASRIQKGWFRRRYFWQGVSDVVMEVVDTSPTFARRMRLAAAAAARILRHPKRLYDLVIDTDDPAEFTRRTFLLAELGRALGLLGLAPRAV
jgi:glycosyltransferase involved in cell wall biosynthesis